MANKFDIDTTADTHLINETFHVFSKSPASPTTTLGGARLKSGHTTTASDVWADEIPAFFNAATQAKFDLFQTKAVKDDLCLFNGNVYKHNGTEFENLGAKDTVLVDGATFSKNDKAVVKYHKGRTAINLTADNNNGDGSNNFTAKIYNAATGSTTFVPQFISAMDKMVDGIPSLAYDAVVSDNTGVLAEGLTADNDYICNSYAGVIQFNKARSSGVTVSAWEYIGDKLTTSIGSIRQSIKDISDVTLKGVVASVTADENTAQKAGITVDNTVSTTPVIKFTEGSVTTGETRLVSGGAVAAVTDALAGRIAQLEGITHFSVAVVDALPTILVENTIYLVPEEGKTSGDYVEYIAYKPEGSETVTTERIGTTAIDLDGYTTDAEHTALANRVTALDAATTGRVAVVEGKVKTLEETTVPAAITTAQGYTDTKIAEELETGGSIATAINAAKEAAIANAKVTLTAGNGITIPNSGEQDTAFTVSVDTSVIATKKSVDDLSDVVSGVSQTVASNKTDLEGQITTAQTTLQGSIDGVSGRVTTLETVTVPGIDTRLQTAEATITSLTTGDASIDSKVNAAKTELQGKIDEINTSLTTGDIHTEIDGVRQTANAAKATADTAVQTVSKSGSSTLLTVTQTGTAVTVGLSDTVATKDDAATAASNAVTTGLAEGGSITQAIATAKSGAEQTAATALSTARGEITTEISTAVSGLETKLTTGEGSLGAKVTALEGSVSEITTTTIPSAITTAKTQTLETTITTATGKDAETAPKVTVELSGTVQTPQLTVTTDDIASAQALAALETKVDNFHKAGVSYQVLQSLPTASASYNGVVVLVPASTDDDPTAVAGDYVEHLCVNKGTEDAPVWDWERIGTTKADLTQYAKSADLNVTETTVNGLTYSQTNGVVSVSVAQASTSQVGTVQLDNTIADSTSETTAATPKAVKEYAQKALTVKDGRETVTENDVWGTTATLDSDGVLTVEHKWLTREDFTENLTAYNGPITKVIDNKVYHNDEFYCNVQTDRMTDMNSYGHGGNIFGYSMTLVEFSSDLSNLTDGYGLFSYEALESFNVDMSSLKNAYQMFGGCENLTSFSSDISSLTNGDGMFGDCKNLTSFSSDLSSLTNGASMFYKCHKLESFSSDLSSLTNGARMFYNTSLPQWNLDLPKLTDGGNMFTASNGFGDNSMISQIESFTGDLSSLRNGQAMFYVESSVSRKLKHFVSDLSSLIDGNMMFEGCELDTESIMYIAESINDVRDLGVKTLDIGIANSEPNEEEIGYFNEIHNKGWSVFVNGSDEAYEPSTDGTSITPIDGEQTVTPKPYWAKPVEVTEEQAHFVGEDGKFYQVKGGQFIYVSDPETYGMFVSREDAIANMRLTKYEKPVEEETEAQA